MKIFKFIFNKIYLKTFFLFLIMYEFCAVAGDDNPFDPGSKGDPSSALPSVIQVIQFLGVLLVKWIAPLVGGYLIFKGCWAGAMSSEQHDKEGWKNKVIFGGCMIAIRVFISMFTTWLS